MNKADRYLQAGTRARTDRNLGPFAHFLAFKIQKRQNRWIFSRFRTKFMEFLSYESQKVDF
jgi:hypothetical protein